ncbi:histidinol-phosphatase [Synechococcus sp. Nb3U1]|uniref:histidinol-phosphatase n=1 Tax=Synechococcus sp. Nb3U1 TaxID=1914529 RepID=UPI001F2068BD|nr:histidinol-phosphatase [Synechococcus sp. Nb3U1]MCF2971795.1 histidinol-phosphatase [Synechococcus sp. Nb3U1]
MLREETRRYGGQKVVKADWIELAQALADAAGAVIRPLFRGDLQAEYKQARSPIVTVADREAERAMRALLMAQVPDHNILGEEFGLHQTGSPYTWVLDPVDGTIAFSTGKPTFGTLIALLEEDRPILGIIDQPVLGERWLGVRGQPTQFNRQPAQTKANTNLSHAYLSCTTPDLFTQPDQQRRFQHLSQSVHVTSYGGDCYQYGLLASGHIDLVLECGLALYDFAALIPVIEGSGGVMTDWQGDPLSRASTGEVLAAANPSLHQQALAQIQAVDSTVHSCPSPSSLSVKDPGS